MIGQSSNCIEPTATRKVKAPYKLGIIKAPKVERLTSNISKALKAEIKRKLIPDIESAWKKFMSYKNKKNTK